jgi:signal transduction histidine kinase
MRLAAEHVRRAHREGAGDFDRILERAVQVIVRQTEVLQRIATDFSDFARLPVQRRDPVDLAPLVTGVLALYDGVDGLTIDTELTDGLPPVLCDRDEFRRVLVNLVGNAVEALDGTEGTVCARLRRDDAEVVLEVADDGPGIPAEAMPRIFEPSFSTKTSGTGLGLAICRRAVESLGGTIALRSRPGEGTVVTVRLPAGDAAEPTA